MSWNGRHLQACMQLEHASFRRSGRHIGSLPSAAPLVSCMICTGGDPFLLECVPLLALCIAASVVCTKAKHVHSSVIILAATQ